jgi:hypothetical protein
MPRILTQDDLDHLTESVWSAVSGSQLPTQWREASIVVQNNEKLQISEFALAGILLHGGDHLERTFTYVRRGFTASDCIEPARGTISQHPIMKNMSQFLEVVALELTACGNDFAFAIERIRLVFAEACLSLFRSVLLRDLWEFSVEDPKAMLLVVYDELILQQGTITSSTGFPHAHSQLALLLRTVIKSGMAGK